MSNIIVDTFELHQDQSYVKIRNLEFRIWQLAKHGKKDSELEREMKNETDNFLRLTHPVLKYKGLFKKDNPTVLK